MLGYIAYKAEVDALLENLAGDILAEPDPTVRFDLLSKELVRYDALVSRLADERAKCAAQMADAGLSHQGIADALSLGTRARAQQLVARGRGIALVSLPR